MRQHDEQSGMSTERDEQEKPMVSRRLSGVQVKLKE